MSSGRPRRVLVIDDEPDILAVTRITLRIRGGFEVEVCASSSEALGAARRFDPDLILLDVMMPGADGPATLELLRGDPQTAATPVVFMTAKATPHETARYLELGAAAVIAKPFDQRSLARELDQIIQGTRSPASERPDRKEPELAKLLDAYAEAVPEKIREIRELWARVESGPDVETHRILYLRLHSLAGTAATYGFPAVGDVARRLEQLIGDGSSGRGKLDADRCRAVSRSIDALDAAAGRGRTPWPRD